MHSLGCTQMRALVEKVDVLGWKKSAGMLQMYLNIVGVALVEIKFYLCIQIRESVSKIIPFNFPTLDIVQSEAK